MFSPTLVFNNHFYVNTSQSLSLIEPFFQPMSPHRCPTVWLTHPSLVSLSFPPSYTTISTPSFCHAHSPTFSDAKLSFLSLLCSHSTSNQLWYPVSSALKVPPKSDLFYVIWLNPSTVGILGMILCCGDSLVLWRILNNIPGLDLLDVITSLACNNQIYLRLCHISPVGHSCPGGELLVWTILTASACWLLSVPIQVFP